MSDDEPKGSPEWIVTFADIVSLLVTFFVLMITFSTFEEEKFQRAAGSLQGSFGAINLEHSRQAFIPKDVRRSVRAQEDGMLTPAEENPLDHDLQQATLKLRRRLGEDINKHLLRGRRHLRIVPNAAFAPGSAALTPELRLALAAVAQAAAHIPNTIRIAARTSGPDDRSPAHPTPWHLSAARAAAAARHLAAARIDPHRVQVAGYADVKPLPGRQRQRNRRLEITLLAPEPRGD